MAHRSQHQKGEGVKGLASFDLKQHAYVVTAQPLKVRVERIDVAGRTHKGHANDVGLLGYHLEIFRILGGE